MLGNFTYWNPTKLYFGEEAMNNLATELSNYGQKVLLVYGSGSIKTNGIYDQVIDILNMSGKEVTELPGVMSNPTLDKLYEGIELSRKNGIEFILEVGGGSVVDYSKALSASIHCTEDPWQKYFMQMKNPDNEIVPLGAVLTMVGTGSEMNGGAVITNTKTKMKIGKVFGPEVFPKFSILNPKVTFTLPRYQMVAGFYDIMSHILEQYFSNTDDNTSDYVMEGMLKSLIHSSLIAVENPEDYESRSNIMWIATWALNTFVAMGKKTDWKVHMMGQSVGAYTNATHGMTLAAVSLPYYRFIMKDGLAKFKRYAINVWDVDPSGKNDEEVAKEGLDAMESYMNKLGVVMKISELGVTEEMIPGIVKGTFLLPTGYHTLTASEVEEILKQSM